MDITLLMAAEAMIKAWEDYGPDHGPDCRWDKIQDAIEDLDYTVKIIKENAHGLRQPAVR